MTTTLGRAKILQSQVNKTAREEPEAFMSRCDEKYEKLVEKVLQHINGNTERSKIIMLSGPSASGKTTTSLKLKQGLERRGIRAITISMDDFFLPRELTPELPDGSRDYESVKALDIALLKSVLLQLVHEGRTELPTFNFKLGRRDKETRKVELPNGSVAVVEGLHALDPIITSELPDSHLLKLYVSVSSDFIDDGGRTILTAREVRLLRRTIRDYHFRGSSPENTLDMWDSVCRGEDLYIRPYKKNADITVNSVFDCEPCLFAHTAMKLFESIEENSKHYDRARRIIAALGTFEQMPLEIVPVSCVLREFIGGSEYYNKSTRHRTV